MEGRCTVFAEPSSSRTTFPPRMGNPQRMAAANLGGKKVHGGGGERIIFKKEHNLAFLSTTHSTPPPRSLVSPPACSSISLVSPSLSPHCSCTTLLTCAFFSVSQAETPARIACWEEQLCEDSELPLRSEGKRRWLASSSELQMQKIQNVHPLFRSPDNLNEPVNYVIFLMCLNTGGYLAYVLL